MANEQLYQIVVSWFHTCHTCKLVHPINQRSPCIFWQCTAAIRNADEMEFSARCIESCKSLSFSIGTEARSPALGIWLGLGAPKITKPATPESSSPMAARETDDQSAFSAFCFCIKYAHDGARPLKLAAINCDLHARAPSCEPVVVNVLGLERLCAEQVAVLLVASQNARMIAGRALGDKFNGFIHPLCHYTQVG